MSHRERRVSTRVRGLELNLLERSGLSNSQVVRYGLRKYYEEHPMSNEYEILTEIAFLRDKINELEMQIEANSLLIQKKVDELNTVRQSRENKEYWFVVNGIYDIYLDFLDDDGLSDEFRSDLKNFYVNCRNSIELIALRVNKSFDEIVDIFESYLEFKSINDFEVEDSLLRI